MNISWNKLPKEEIIYMKQDVDFELNTEIGTLVNWVLKNINTIPNYENEEDDMKTTIKGVLSQTLIELDNFKNDFDTIITNGSYVDIGRYTYALYPPYRLIHMIIVPSEHIDKTKDFIFYRRNIEAVENDTDYSGIYTMYQNSQFGTRYESSYVGIPIKSEYVIDKDKTEQLYQPYIANYGLLKKDEPYYEKPVPDYNTVYYENGAYYLRVNTWYSGISQLKPRIINMCTVSDTDYDGKSHANTVLKPNRHNLNSTQELPTYYNLSGLGNYNLYNIPTEQLDECISYLNSGVVVSTSSGFLSWLKLLSKIAQYTFLDWINKRYDYLISWKMIYHNIETSTQYDSTINVGILDNIEVGNYKLTNQIEILDCGSIDVKSESFVDFEPYTKYELYLPFVNTVSINANLICGRKIHVKYIIDNITTEALCIVSTIDADVEQIIQTFQCNVGVDLPYKAFDYLSNIRRNASGLVSLAKDYLVNNMPTETDNTDDVVDNNYTPSSQNVGYEQATCIRSNVGSSLLSSMLPRKPYLITTRLPMYNVDDSSKINGRPTLEYATLDTYTDCIVSVRNLRTDELDCTDTEKNMIKNILMNGVIL